eukprot:CAMPEP_0115675882 /NCGR_PEP_ID=MMETSP0272-20121206/54390_1 /TAXON_ID=71861 /ORGANISM="Scrippsiella trochoidea, Strain CCMP3099" /LENGTH=271 /DNA_ID=CAMNT_0003114885 /DNA_START=18 /DNA_END=831 /DNA_ORIENTATION=-
MVACAEEVRRRLEVQRLAKERALKNDRAEVEEDSDDEEFPASGGGVNGGGSDAGGKRFIWDAKKGQLLEACAQPKERTPNGDETSTGQQGVEQASRNVGETNATLAKQAIGGDINASDAPIETSTQKRSIEDGKDDDGKEGSSAESSDEESEQEEQEEEGGEIEVASRNAFLNDASTPELVKQAIAVGGPVADGVCNRWVLDQATQLYFRYDTTTRQMHCWNPGQGCMYLWKERGKMDFFCTPGDALCISSNAALQPTGQQAEHQPSAEEK